VTSNTGLFLNVLNGLAGMSQSEKMRGKVPIWLGFQGKSPRAALVAASGLCNY